MRRPGAGLHWRVGTPCIVSAMKRSVSEVTAGNLRTYDTAWSVAEYTRDESLLPIEATLVTEVFPPPPARIVDLGCGAGRTTVALSRLGYQVVGIDLSPALLAAARQRHPELEFHHMDATDLVFPDATFDAALFSYNGIDCIYPVSTRLKCLAEAFRVLKPGGTFLVSSHNLIGALFSGGYWYLRGHWNAMKLLAQQWRNRTVREWYIRYEDGSGPHHLYSAPPASTIQQLQRVGFDVLDVRGFTGERRMRAIRMHQQHVQFVARKPGVLQ